MHIYCFLYNVSSRFHHHWHDVFLPSQRQVDDYLFTSMSFILNVPALSHLGLTVYTALPRQS